MKTRKKKKKIVYIDDEEEDEDLNEKLKNCNINKDNKNTENSRTQIINVNSLDNVREDDSPPSLSKVTRKKKKKKAGSYSETISDDVSDVDPMNISTVGELPNINHKKKYYYEDDEGKRTKSDEEIRDSRTELFQAKSNESLQEYNEKKVKKKKKKKIIVVYEDENDEYEERIITKKKKKKKNRTSVGPTAVCDDEDEFLQEIPTSPNDNGQLSKLQPIRLRGSKFAFHIQI